MSTCILCDACLDAATEQIVGNRLACAVFPNLSTASMILTHQPCHPLVGNQLPSATQSKNGLGAWVEENMESEKRNLNLKRSLNC